MGLIKAAELSRKLKSCLRVLDLERDGTLKSRLTRAL